MAVKKPITRGTLRKRKVVIFIIDQGIGHGLAPDKRRALRGTPWFPDNGRVGGRGGILKRGEGEGMEEPLGGGGWGPGSWGCGGRDEPQPSHPVETGNSLPTGGERD